MVEKWKKQLKKRSGNFTTNEAMPEYLIDNLLEEDLGLKEKIYFSEVNFPNLNGVIGEIKGLNILAGLQAVTKTGCLTLFRAVRFATYKRMYGIVYNKGYAILNYEQERILDLYNDKNYRKKREQVKQDPLFWTQPQERVVKGLPIFYLINDALQIHRAFRSEEDRVIIIAIHIPRELLETGKIKLISNAPIDFDFDNDERDYEIKDFVQENGAYKIDLSALASCGIDLYEMYTNDLPWQISEAENLGITQDFFLLDIHKITANSKLNELREDTKVLKNNGYFLHGFFGDQNVFGRKRSEYLPFKCQKISKKFK